MSADNLLTFLIKVATNPDFAAAFADPETRQQTMVNFGLTQDEQDAIGTGDIFTVRRKLGLDDDVPFNQAGGGGAIAAARGAKKTKKAAKKAAKKAVKKTAKKTAKKAAKKSGGRKR